MLAISQECEVAYSAVVRFLEQAGSACATFHDRTVQGIQVRRVQLDVTWSFGRAQQRGKGKHATQDHADDLWTWTALDLDSKMLLSWSSGGRDAESARLLTRELLARIESRVQLTTDGRKAYFEVGGEGSADGIDYELLVKICSPDPTTLMGSHGAIAGHQELPTKVARVPVAVDGRSPSMGRPDVQTRMGLRRFAAVSDDLSNNLEHHFHALSLYFLFYNFARIHPTLGTSPAIAAGVADKLMSVDEIGGFIDAMNPPPAKRGPYKRRPSEWPYVF